MKETVVVAFSTDAQNASHVASALRLLASHACHMPGCLSYSATTAHDNPNAFHIWYTWETETHWDAYLRSDAMQTFERSVEGMLHNLKVTRQAPLRVARECCL